MFKKILIFDFVELPVSVSGLILSVYKKYFKITVFYEFLFFIFAIIFCYIHLLFVNAVYIVSFQDAFFWLIIFPLQVFYLLFGKVCCFYCYAL